MPHVTLPSNCTSSLCDANNGYSRVLLCYGIVPFRWFMYINTIKIMHRKKSACLTCTYIETHSKCYSHSHRIVFHLTCEWVLRFKEHASKAWPWQQLPWLSYLQPAMLTHSVHPKMSQSSELSLCCRYIFQSFMCAHIPLHTVNTQLLHVCLSPIRFLDSTGFCN